MDSSPAFQFETESPPVYPLGFRMLDRGLVWTDPSDNEKPEVVVAGKFDVVAETRDNTRGGRGAFFCGGRIMMAVRASIRRSIYELCLGVSLLGIGFWATKWYPDALGIAAISIGATAAIGCYTDRSAEKFLAQSWDKYEAQIDRE